MVVPTGLVAGTSARAGAPKLVSVLALPGIVDLGGKNTTEGSRKHRKHRKTQVHQKKQKNTAF